jgi:hypothetical protein
MSRPDRAFSKSSMLKALSAANLGRARQTLSERRRWVPRVVAAGLGGVVVGLAVGLLVARVLLGA